MRSTLAIHTARAKPRRRQLLRKARERLERVGGPAIVPVPFFLEPPMPRMSAIGGKADIGATFPTASDCSAINPACVNFVFLQCGVVAYRPAGAGVARDYRRFVVSRPAAQESQVSRCQH